MATIVERIVGQSALPFSESLGYQRPKSVFGGFWHETRDHRLVWTQNIISHADRWGDDFLRRFDEHTVPLRRVLRRTYDQVGSLHHDIAPLLSPSAKRSRGTSEEIMENVRSLSWMEGQKRRELSEFYGLYEVNGEAKGIEGLQPDVIKGSITLEDIILGLPGEKMADRYQAYRLAADHIRNVHQTSGRGIGELLANDILFRRVEDGVVMDPLLNIPDIIYRQRKQRGPKVGLSDQLIGNVPEPVYKPVPTLDQQATDMLDFMMSIAVWESRRAERLGEAHPHPYNIKRVMEEIVAGYREADTTGEADRVIRLVRSFAVRGRLSLQGDEDIIDTARNEMGQQAADKINAGREAAGLDPLSYHNTPYRRTHMMTASHNEARLGISRLKRRNRITAARLARQGVIDACAI